METKISRPSFDKTVGVLVKAYLNGTLEHWNCAACAVGNLVAAGMGYGFVYSDRYAMLRWIDQDQTNWQNALCGFGVCDLSKLNHKQTRLEIESTGYTPQELSRIEKAFEGGDSDGVEDIMLQGLLNTVDVLADIHGVDLSIKDQAKKLFLKTI